MRVGTGLVFVILLALNGFCQSSVVIDMDDMKMDLDLYKLFFPHGIRLKSVYKGALAQSYSVWDNIKTPDGKWIIPYTIDDSITSATMKKSIADAITDYETKLCFQFVKREDEPFYMRFQDKSSGCSSYVGRRPQAYQPNEIQLQQNGCFRKGTVIHEIMHALGFMHEHQRPDRDQYVIVHEDKVDPRAIGNFEKYDSGLIDSRGVPYDYNSVMHYPSSSFPADGDWNTLTITKKDGTEITEYQRDGLSESDIQQLKAMYKCEEAEAVTTEPTTTTSSTRQPPTSSSLPITTLPPTTASSTNAPPPIACSDVVSKTKCQKRLKKGLCEKRPIKMKKKCAESCDLCTCQDSSDCGNPRKSQCYSGDAIERMRTSCPVVCGYCGESCQDLADTCERAECEVKRAYMARNCRRTCGWCITNNMDMVM